MEKTYDIRIFGKLVRIIRRAKGMRQHTLAQLADIKQPNLSRIENDYVTPRADTKRRILASLSITMDQLYSDHNIILLESNAKIALTPTAAAATAATTRILWQLAKIVSKVHDQKIINEAFTEINIEAGQALQNLRDLDPAEYQKQIPNIALTNVIAKNLEKLPTTVALDIFHASKSGDETTVEQAINVVSAWHDLVFRGEEDFDPVVEKEMRALLNSVLPKATPEEAERIRVFLSFSPQLSVGPAARVILDPATVQEIKGNLEKLA